MKRSEIIALAERAMAEEEFERALSMLSPLLQRDGRNEKALLLEARCQTALGRQEAAETTYRFIEQNQGNFSSIARAEAHLLFGRDANVLELLHNTDVPEGQLLAAVAAYRLGRIAHCQKHLHRFIRAGEEWQDEDAISPLLMHLLPRPEFLDFEQIYLDARDNYGRGESSSQNRWFALNMPIYELYTAGTPQKRKARALILAQLLIDQGEVDLNAGRANLLQILQDFAASQEDARFGLESLKQLNEGRYARVAKNILSMQLEHLAQFGEHIGLTAAVVRDSQLQQLIPMLPHRLALCLMLLYAISGSEDRLMQAMQQEVEPELTTALISLAFKGFYQEFDRIRQKIT
ncbi:hypothetical protein JXO59_11605 [candidate division KSB1 bacterium]|nr:hypothetical protein [candidate division KSB1 bacterium]